MYPGIIGDKKKFVNIKKTLTQEIQAMENL
jgi:hypothetical protein